MIYCVFVTKKFLDLELSPLEYAICGRVERVPCARVERVLVMFFHLNL